MTVAGHRPPVAGVFVCAWLLVSSIARAAAADSLTEAPRLAAIYDLILAAQFDRAEASLRDACPPAPREACLTLESVARWWQIQTDSENRTADAAFNAAAEKAIDAATAWTKREPDRAEAWFYLAGAHAPLVQWRLLRGHRLAAARDGKKIKDALEQALRLDPTFEDAHFGLGLYLYYADVAPVYAKMLRWMLLLPGGDRAAGLRAMLRARDRGALLRGEADFQLHFVYLWYEQQPQRALDLVTDLDRRYPTNPIFLERIADIQSVYLHDASAAAATYRTLLERARRGSVYNARRIEVRAQRGLDDVMRHDPLVRKRDRF